MNTHTPGPWAFATSDEGWTYSIYQTDDAPFTPESSDVATLFARTVECDPRRTQEANARLIAAAPLMLEALRRCKFDSLNMSLADLDFCRAAIAATIGEQS